MPLKIFLSLNFSFELGHLHKSLLPSTKGLPIYLHAIFIFISVSIFSYEAPTREHCDHTWALDIANMWVCFVNGSMIGLDGLGITFFSVDILEDMVACWYAWVFKSSFQIYTIALNYLKVLMSMLLKKIICDEHVRQHSTSKILFLPFTYTRMSKN